MKYSSVFVSLLCIYIVFAGPVFAQENKGFIKKTSLGVNPAIVELILDENNPTEKEILLYNLTNFAIPIKTLKQSFSPKEKLELSAKEIQRFDASSWISIAPENTDFILQPKEIRKINLKVAQPKQAAPGGHYAEIVFQPLIPQSLISNESIYVFARVAILVFLQVKGSIVENLDYKQTLIKKFYQEKPDSISLILKNNGNVHLFPNGQFFLTDEIAKKSVGKLNITPGIILPGTAKEFKISFENLNLKRGKYSLVGSVVYGVNNQLINIPKSEFFIFPYIKSIVIFIIFVIIMTIIFIVRKRITKALKILIFNK